MNLFLKRSILFSPRLVLISLVIAFISAAFFVQRGFVYGYLGDVVGGWIFLLVLIMIIILSIPFYIAFSRSVGSGIASGIIFVLIWIVLKFFIDIDDLIPYNANVPYEFFQFYDFVTSFWMLAIGLAAGILFAIIKNSGGGRRGRGTH